MNSASLEKFFDRVNHDVLVRRLAKRIADRRVLGLVRPLSQCGRTRKRGGNRRHADSARNPIANLPNMLLDESNRVRKRGHAFVRYSDDLNI